MDLAPANTEPNNLLETRVEWHKEGETYDDVLTRNYEEWQEISTWITRFQATNGTIQKACHKYTPAQTQACKYRH
jgi:16S rRNA G527 N7-methylase RsmG